MANGGSMGVFDDTRTFAKNIIGKFGVVEGWYLLHQEITEISNNPTKPNQKTTRKIPIEVAIASWEVDLINETTILSGDRKCYIAYNPALEGLIKADNYIIKEEDNKEIMRYKIVTPTRPLVFKDIIAAYMVNIRM